MRFLSLIAPVSAPHKGGSRFEKLPFPKSQKGKPHSRQGAPGGGLGVLQSAANLLMAMLAGGKHTLIFSVALIAGAINSTPPPADSFPPFLSAQERGSPAAKPLLSCHSLFPNQKRGITFQYCSLRYPLHKGGFWAQVSRGGRILRLRALPSAQDDTWLGWGSLGEAGRGPVPYGGGWKSGEIMIIAGGNTAIVHYKDP